MRVFADVWERVRSLLFRTREDQEMDEELRFHLERETEKLIEAGLDASEARRQAHLRFGGVARFKEEVRDARGLRLLEELDQDLRSGARMLRRAPGFAAVAILTLALGIGANATVFSLVNGLLLRPYPYPDADQVVRLYSVDTRTGKRRFPSYPDLIDLREQNTVLAGLAGSDREPFNVRAADATVYAQGARASANLFDVLGVQPVLGRTSCPTRTARAPTASSS